ncbi:serine hydrolase domain-containing protein [Yunchengibacter salinarum]|uniref:serine hydrolase domain-containing protein n=1 Tax=Yunchengibacter salinarum TaxID=3133399 RepID=UPI0035B5CB83
MTAFLRGSVLLAVSLAALLGARAPVQANKDGAAALVAPFSRAFRAEIREAGVPGAAYAIVAGGEVLDIGATGTRSLKSGGAVGPDTVFPLASVSKTFAGTLAGRMVASGTLDLDDRLAAHVPRFQLLRKQDTDALRLEHVLSHGTGLVPNAYDNLLEAGRPVTEIVQRFRGLKPMCQPGSCYGYQNVMFSLFAPVVERLTDQDYADAVRDQLLQPLGMKHSSVGAAGFQAAQDRAMPHAKWRGGWHQIRPSTEYYKVAPAAGVNASVRDMARWLKAHMGARRDVVSDAVRRIITTPRIQTRRELYRRLWREHLTDAYYGLGWRLYHFEGDLVVHHGGGFDGYRTAISYLPDFDVGLVILMNGNARAIDRLTIDFLASARARLSPLRGTMTAGTEPEDDGMALQTDRAPAAPEPRHRVHPRGLLDGEGQRP